MAETVQGKSSTASIEGQPQQATVVVKTGNSADLRSRLQHYQRHQSNEVGWGSGQSVKGRRAGASYVAYRRAEIAWYMSTEQLSNGWMSSETL